MNNLRTVIALFTTSLLLIIVTKSFAAEPPVVICSDPYPPFIYETTDGDKNETKLVGLHTLNFKLVEELTGLDIQFRLLPWKRCLSEVENVYDPSSPEIAIGTSFNLERYKKYYMVGPVYSTNYALFYSNKKFPGGPYAERFGRVISNIADMQDFRICGLLGWNYDFWYTKYDMPRSVKVDLTPGGHQSLMGMLSVDRCDVVVVNIESVLGATLTGDLEMPEDIECRYLETAGKLKNYMAVSRNSPRAEMLVARLSSAITYLQETNKWLRLTDMDMTKLFPEKADSLIKCR